VQHAPDSEAGTVLYRFRVGDFSLLWNDSAGPLADDAPETFETFKSLRPIDVQVGAIQGFNQLTNGMRDPRQYIEAFAPALFVPAHHDDWAAGITTKGDAYREPLAQELARIPAERRPQVRFISDPGDYVRPEALTFPVKLEPLAISRRCTERGLMRAALTGDAADVRSVVFRVSGGRSRSDRSAPFTYPLAGSTSGRLVADVTDVEGGHRTLTRELRPCRAKQ
jgi:hypothetical protein